MIRREIKVRDCVHYRGFRYGGFGHNIYEDYLIGLASGVYVGVLRRQLINRVLAFRGRDFAGALGVSLSKEYAPWVYPWSIRSVWVGGGGDLLPQENPDVVCHFSSAGVLSSHLNREFFWLERAYSAMEGGYRPDEFGYCRVMALRKGRCVRYLVLDGNHRVSAMHAHGVESFVAEVLSPFFLTYKFSLFWPGVLCGVVSLDDARIIFERYFFEENFALSEIPEQRLIFDEPLDI